MVAVALAVAVSGFACGTNGDRSFEVQRGSQWVQFGVEGGGEAEVELLREIAERTNPSELTTIRLENPPNDVGAFTVEGTRWLRFEYASFAAGPSFVELYWRSGLIAVAYRRAAEQRGFPLVRGWTVAGDAFQIRTDSFQISADPFSGSVDDPDLDADGLVERLTNERRETLRVDSLEIVRPFRAAPAIVLETTDPVGFFCDDDDDLGDLIGAGPFGDGLLIRVLDTGGDVVWTLGEVSGAGNSMRWAMPGFQGEEYPSCRP